MEVVAENDGVTALMASLSRGFGKVHLSAIPSMMDCILSSTRISPSLLLDSLLGSFAVGFEEVVNEECAMDTGKCKYMSAQFCAISYLVKDIGDHGDRFQTYVWKAFVPLMKKVHIVDPESLRQIITLFLDVVVETDAWKDLGISLVPSLLRSMRVPSEIGRISRVNGEDGNYVVVHSCLDESTSSTAVECESMNGLPPPGFIGLSLSCRILSEILDAALSSGEQPPARLSVSMDKFVGDLLHDLCILAEQLLLQSLEYRSSAISILLPVIFKAFTSEIILRSLILGPALPVFWRHFPEKIWNCCRKMFSLGYLERRDAYRVLSLYLSFSESTETGKHDYIKGQMGKFDIRAEKEFWDEIKRGLVDKDALLRKQALHMLKGALGKKEENQEFPCTSSGKSGERHSSTQTLTRRELWAEKEAKSLGIGRELELSESGINNQQMWGAFLLLYEMLQEYGTHLVEAAWNHQVSSLLHFSISNNSLESYNCDIGIQTKIISSEFPVWLAILWERGFHHDNPQVRCLILESFLSIDWSKFGECASALDESFVLGPLIQGLNDPVHHEDFGIKGVYASIILEGAARFFFHYTGHLDVRRQITLLKNLASLAKQQSFSRAGLMTLSECIASVGCRTSLDNEVELAMLHDTQSYNGQAESSLAPSSDHHCTDLLDALRYVVESGKQHFNPNYRLQVCQKILGVAVSIVCPESVPLEMLLHFVSAFPGEFIDYGGALQITLQQWLSGGRAKCSCRTCKDGGIGLLRSLYGFPAEFVCALYVGQSSFVCDDEELAAWEGEAKRWVMVLFLVANDKDSFDPLCLFIYDYGTQICEEKKISQWQTIKYLILLLSVACQLQLLSDKDSDFCADPGRKLPFGCLLDTLNGTYQKFLHLFNSIMENLVLHAKVSCLVLLSTFELETTKLPNSVRGKLGGPSQRRLSSEMTSSVLQAITSVKLISSLSSWCKKFGSNVWDEFAFEFFWDILWRTLSSSTCNSETEAEIGLAAYETLTPVLRTLTSTYTSLSLNHIAKQRNPVAADMEDEPFLDVLVKKFLHNINWLLEVGYLARSRKAALMKFKWHCLESLLSIPNLALKSGYTPTGCKYYFSDDVVRQAFAELVENLENAAEDAVLPMLRSIRLVLALLTSRSDILVSGCGGVNVQMIWQLVQSSWILHVSCNKRRVAAIAALLSSVLHPLYFSDETMHMINGASGPLKWFVEKVLEEGTKSPRTIRLAALHLTGLWLVYPRILKYYIKELKLLSLHGSVAFDEDFEGELIDNMDAKAEVSLLAMSPEPELTKAFINTELYARVSVAALFQKLADLADNDALVDIHDDKTAACEAGRLFLLELLNSVVNEKDLAKELYKKYSAIHRRKIRAWQMICGLSRFVCEDILDQVTSSLHISLYMRQLPNKMWKLYLIGDGVNKLNNLPAVRQYLETFAINVYLKFPSLVKEQLLPILQDYNTKPQALSSYVFIAANIILHAPDQLKSKHLDDLLPPIIPLLTSHHHSLRGFTQLLVYKVLHKLFPPSSVGVTQYISLEERCFKNLREYLAKNSDCMRLRASMEGYLDAYDPVISATPAGIFVNRVEDLQFECVPTSLMEEVLTFLNAVREDLRCSMAKDLATIKCESLRLGEDKSNSDLSCDDKSDTLLSLPPANASANFQKKFTLSKHEKQESRLHTSLGFSDLYQQTLGEMEKDDQLLDQSLQSRITTMGKVRASRQQIILVASLLDRIPNLAGLARTCEVFKASGLAIADTTVLQDKQFQLISVTAEKWVPIIEIPVQSLIGFLEKKRREGFSVLGLEQTANSVNLDKFAFPEKTVLVLGREKEGIPVDIIHILDACIEIPQLGIVRSLNVHVSGALALWEYTRQQRSR